MGLLALSVLASHLVDERLLVYDDLFLLTSSQRAGLVSPLLLLGDLRLKRVEANPIDSILGFWGRIVASTGSSDETKHLRDDNFKICSANEQRDLRGSES